MRLDGEAGVGRQRDVAFRAVFPLSVWVGGEELPDSFTAVEVACRRADREAGQVLRGARPGVAAVLDGDEIDVHAARAIGEPRAFAPGVVVRIEIGELFGAARDAAAFAAREVRGR